MSARNVAADHGSRLRPAATAALGLGVAANGAWMLLAPAAWARTIPGAPAPFNAHLVRDVGLAYLAAGGGLAWLARDARAFSAAGAGALFLAGHAALHVGGGFAAGAAGRAALARDVPGVIAPAVMALWLVWSARRAARRDVRQHGRGRRDGH